jgi:hypothetical protein
MIFGLTIFLVVVILAIIISSLPLYFSVKLLGGDASILKVFLTNILMGVVSAILMKMFGFGGLAVLLFTILLYAAIFDMGFIRSFFVWLIQYVIAFLLVILFVFILGISFII